MDAIEILRSQHRRVRRLLREVEAAAGDERQARFLDLADALAVHAAIEERYFYPTLYGERTRAMLLDEVEEHLAIKRTLADLMQPGLAAGAFEALLVRLIDLFARHVDAEEATLFPRVPEALDERQRAELARIMSGAIDDLEDRDLRGSPTESDELFRIASSS